MPMPNLPIKTGHLFIGLAIVMGVVTLGIFSTGKKTTELKLPEATIQTELVVVPLSTINQGGVLSSKDLKLVKWPVEYLPKGDFFKSTVEVVGRIAKQNLFPGEPIFSQKVSGGKSRGGLPSLIPDGKRAITISVTEVKGVAGFVKPGDRVDVLSTFELKLEDGKDSLQKTKTLLQNVLVLASAQTLENSNGYTMETPEAVHKGEVSVGTASTEKPGKKSDGKEQKKSELSSKEVEAQAKAEEKKRRELQKAARLVSSVTLAISPEQAEVLAVAEESGRLRLILRPENDHRTHSLTGSNSAELSGEVPSKPKPDTAPVVHSVKPPPVFYDALSDGDIEFIQGTEKTTIQTDNPL